MISDRNKIPEKHMEYLEKLKKEGFEPKVIYDIGSCVLNWTKAAKKIWPNSIYVLFDGNMDVEFLYKEIGELYFIGVLSDKTGQIVKWYENPLLVAGNSYYRENNKLVFPEDRFSHRITHSLDDVVSNMNFPKPDLVKIDVQGCEKDIIDGGFHTISCAKHLIVEMQDSDYNIGAPKVWETLPHIERILNMKCISRKFCDNGPDADYGFVNINGDLF